jgi:signal transduction histidine kinase/DNA-binding response OmpR family regulator
VPRTEVMGRSESDLPGLLGLAGTSWSELTERWGREQGHPDVQEIHEEQCECQGRVISMRVAPVVRQGMFEGTVSVFRDITKDIEVDRMKSEFISMVSHELRTPMTSIKGYIDLLYSGMAGPVTDGQKRFLQTAKVNVDRLTMLVNSLLEISHFDTGKVRLSIEAVNPLQAVKEVVDDMRAAAEEKGQSLVSVIQAPVPNVRADPARLKNVLAQLVDNACKYTPEGGRITINAREVEGYVHFSVQDNGVGISPKDRTKLFSRFFRADDPQIQAYAGTGLGLVIAKSYVELHGGEMWVESELGRGSTFTFSIPLATAETEVKARLAFKTIRYRSQDRHILVIEDEVDVANEIAYQLRGQGGYRVHVATCARDALDYLAQAGHPIDLITLDLRLPDMNGLEFLSQLKKDKRHVDTPVVVVSVLAEQQEGRLDVEEYLSKPIQGERLLATIGEVLAERTKVLIVEDDKLLAEALRLALENYGFTAVVEHDGLKAVDVVRDERPGLILLDIKLPGMDGHTILRKLKATPDTREIPVIVITGSVSDVETKRQQVMEVGAAQFLTKPIQISDLVAEIQHALADERQA